MQVIGDMMATKQVWERAIVPSLLSVAGAWVSITAEAVEMFEEMH